MKEEEIRKAAYAKWEAEGRPDGAHERHWHEAVDELRSASPGGTGKSNSGISDPIRVQEPSNEWPAADADPVVPTGDEAAALEQSSEALETRAHSLAERYLALGGKRMSKVDDNIINVREWAQDPPAAEEFWQEQIQVLPENDRKQVEILLPNLSES